MVIQVAKVIKETRVTLAPLVLLLVILEVKALSDILVLVTIMPIR